ncbi:hypothetical protein [Streptomyces sp. NBC_01190]|uniref:hypothetical protein n=1 Tax=Streptomyces sp. NBC_01190 TaxID=2903767 RepID=UPI00386CD302|nr:hypothetical protein OG519_32585 [Streptomyces sp. NBC_01190]
MFRRVLASLTAVTALGGAALGSGAGPAAADGAGPSVPPPTACARVIRINDLTFDPARVTAGETSDLTLDATNCTGQSQAVTETWAGTWLSATTTGVPAGCPVIDPLPRQVTFAPHARTSTVTGYLVFAGCAAAGLRGTVTIEQAGVQLARQSAVLLIDQP